MSDPQIQTLASRWNTGLAEQVIQQITAHFWENQGHGDEALLASADQMRQILKQRLGQSSVPVEQVRLLEASYNLEQGLARRDVALSLAKNLRHLTERKTDAMHQARAAFLLAQAWYWVSALPFSIDWSKRGFGEAKPIEQRNQGGRPCRILYAEQEVKLALRLALQGGMHEQACRLLADAAKRFEAIGDTTGQAATLAAETQVHMLQGKWSLAIDATRKLQQAADSSKPPLAGGLWAGARAACRSGDLPAARSWIEAALQASRQMTDLSTPIACHFTSAAILLRSGERDAALAAADQAVELTARWRLDIFTRWAMLERSWIRLTAGHVDIDETRATADAFAKFGAGTLEAEAQYALYHALKDSNQDAQTAYDRAIDLFTRFKMDWHLARAAAREPLLSDRS